MSKRQLGWSVAIALLICGLWLAWPAYQFLVYQKGAPFPALGLVDVPETGPVTSHTDHAGFIQAAAQARDLLNEHRVRIQAPGISAAIAIGGQLVWRGTSGWADIEHDIPVTPNTQFRLGSTTKALTATALARLVQNRTITLDTSIDTYLQRIPSSEWRVLTVRQLASHSTGLPEYKKNRDWIGLYQTMALRRHFHRVVDSLELFDDTPLLFVPGSEFHYSSFNTVLLSAAMVAAAEQPFREIFRQQVASPLGLERTVAESQAANPNVATFYWRKHGKVKPWRRVDLSHRLAAGGYLSTPTELVKLGAAWLDADFIQPDIRTKFWQPQRLNNGEINAQNYAIGWRIHPGDDHIAANANHGGVSRGSQSWLMVIPEYQMSVAVMVNVNTSEFWDFAQVVVPLYQLFSESMAH